MKKGEWKCQGLDLLTLPPRKYLHKVERIKGFIRVEKAIPNGTHSLSIVSPHGLHGVNDVVYLSVKITIFGPATLLLVKHSRC